MAADVVDPSILIAFFAGLISFLSPCVLPLVPGYLAYMSGFGPEDETSRERALHTARVASIFVGGFTLVFVALGATATLLGSFMRDNQKLLTQVSGVVIIFFGLVFMGVIKFPFLYREKRFHPTPGAGAWGSFVLGGAFAFGWTPCIGATLGPILSMAAGRGSTGGPGEGALLLAFYSLGLGVPFILAALGISQLTGALTWLRTHARGVNLVGGAFLVLVGILFVTDQMFRIAIWIQNGFLSLNLDDLAQI